MSKVQKLMGLLPMAVLFISKVKEKSRVGVSDANPDGDEQLTLGLAEAITIERSIEELTPSGAKEKPTRNFTEIVVTGSDIQEMEDGLMDVEEFQKKFPQIPVPQGTEMVYRGELKTDFSLSPDGVLTGRLGKLSLKEYGRGRAAELRKERLGNRQRVLWGVDPGAVNATVNAANREVKLTVDSE